MGYESRYADHYDRRTSVQGLSLRVQPGEPPAMGTGLLPGHPTRWGRVAGDLTPGRGSRPVPDRRGARGYRFSPEPGARDRGAGSIASPPERRRRRICLHTVPDSGHAGRRVHGPSSRPAGGTRDPEGAPRRTKGGGRALVRPSRVFRKRARPVHAPSNHVIASGALTNHLVGKMAGPSISSFPAFGNPGGMRKANLRTPAAPYRGMMWASRQAM